MINSYLIVHVLYNYEYRLMDKYWLLQYQNCQN